MDIKAIPYKKRGYNLLSNEDAVGVHKTSSYQGNGLIDTPNDKLTGMKDKERINRKKEPLEQASILEKTIEENSGDYDRKALYEKFSKKISPQEFNDIIEKLHESGKIAIDHEGMVCWTWNPELVTKMRTDEKFAARWIR